VMTTRMMAICSKVFSPCRASPKIFILRLSSSLDSGFSTNITRLKKDPRLQVFFYQSEVTHIPHQFKILATN
jgi:hypothetical protein